MNGHVQTYKQVQSFGHSAKISGDFPFIGRFPRWSANGLFNNIMSALKVTTEVPFDTTLSTFGSLSGTFKWIGGVNYNEFVYGIPFNSTSILKINTQFDTATTFGSFAGSAKWAGGVLAPNGFIYGIPRDGTTILKIDPRLDQATTFGSLVAGADKWYGGVLGPDGIIYCAPFTETRILKIDTNDDSISYIELGQAGSSLGCSIGIRSSGDIYFIPTNSSALGGIIKLRIYDQSIRIITISTGGNAWQSGVLAANGCIYCIPHNATQVLKINTQDDSLTLFGSLGAGTLKWSAGVLGIDGNIYGIPRTDTTVLKIDTVNDTATTFGSVTSPSYFGGTLAPNGAIYSIPVSNTAVLKIGNNMLGQLDYDFVQNRNWNKL